MSDELNPYASPTIPAERAEASSGDAMRQLLAPTIALLVLSGAMASVGVFQFPYALLMLTLELTSALPKESNTLEASVEDYLLLLTVYGGNFLVLAGAATMLLGRAYKFCYAAAIVASIPCLSPWLICGIPFGIWALIVLNRQEVKEAFARKKARSHVAASATD